MEATNCSNNNIVINNFYFIIFDDLKEIINSASLFQPIKNYSTKSFKTQSRQGPKNTIIITEEKAKDTNRL